MINDLFVIDHLTSECGHYLMESVQRSARGWQVAGSCGWDTCGCGSVAALPPSVHLSTYFTLHKGKVDGTRYSVQCFLFKYGLQTFFSNDKKAGCSKYVVSNTIECQYVLNVTKRTFLQTKVHSNRGNKFSCKIVLIKTTISLNIVRNSVLSDEIVIYEHQ